jgi:uncharacterized membrane-anchored protein YjiN (DUF445 family)
MQINDSLSLTRMKRIALGLLLLMVGLFAFSSWGQTYWPWLVWMRVFSEAAMIGALADWFAVVALFRHPLGLPIPHTAIIPRNKDRLAETMGRFVQSNFLSEEVLKRKLAEWDVAKRVAEWLIQPPHTEKAAMRIVQGTVAILDRFDDTTVKQFLHRSIEEGLQGVKFAPLAGHILEIAIESDRKHELVHQIFRGIERLIERHQRYLQEALRAELPWYVPNFVHDRIYSRIVEGARERIAEVNADLNHPLRAHVETLVREYVHDLKSSPKFAEKGEEFKQWLLNEPLLQSYISQLLKGLRELIRSDAQSERSNLRRFIAQLLQALGAELQGDNEMRQKLNSALEEALQYIIYTYQDEIVKLVSDTVKSWEVSLLIEKIELEVGRDLQFIRINGTIVGGLAGVTIYGVSLLVRGWI